MWKNNWLSSRVTLSIMVIMLVMAPTTFAAKIIINNNDNPGEGFNDPTPFTPVGGNRATTIGEARLNAFQFAADIWGCLLESSVEITVNATFDPLYCNESGAVLGGAGPQTVHRDFPGAQVAETWYPQALANSLAETDLEPDWDDIGATFNSQIDNNDNCLKNRNWYYGFDGNPPSNEMDFVSVILHELAHGLGFTTFVSLGNGAKFLGYNDVYMLNLQRHGANPSKYPDMSDLQRFYASFGDPNLRWAGENVSTEAAVLPLGTGFENGQVQMHAPYPQQYGSSVSHFSTVLSPNELMEPFYTGPNHDVGLALALMEDLGWKIDLTTCFSYGKDAEEKYFLDSVASGPLTPWFEEGCALYGVDDKGRNNSRFFCINKQGGQWVSNELPGYDIEGLDYHEPFLLASAGDDTTNPGEIFELVPATLSDLFQCKFKVGIPHGQIVRDEVIELSSPHPVSSSPLLQEVDSIAFDEEGQLWGWAQESGLFNTGLFNPLAESILATVYWWPGEVEDMVWLDKMLYGAINLNHETQKQDGDPVFAPEPNSQEDVNAIVNADGVVTIHLVQYDPSTGTLDFPCSDEIADELSKIEETGFAAMEIEALEALDDENLLLGFHASPTNALILGVLNLTSCHLDSQVVYDIPIDTQALDVEGLAMVCPSLP